LNFHVTFTSLSFNQVVLTGTAGRHEGGL
jgi:hypothetical protein